MDSTLKNLVKKDSPNEKNRKKKHSNQPSQRRPKSPSKFATPESGWRRAGVISHGAAATAAA
jgi:hypothetical protein